ncbi:MAG: KH domain-containing protein [Clostridia bacterium]|nr:KH domain-containing protein [Clostridia bacterium]MBQ7728534.1 KH domain-containing protein [Clostridia bacterium]
MKQTLTDIAKAVVNSPEDVTVTIEEDDDSIVLTLMVAPDDMGMVIGRHGKIAKNIRTMMKAAVAGTGKKIIVDIR